MYMYCTLCLVFLWTWFFSKNIILSNNELNLLCRITDALFHALLLWYYSTLTLQEHILIANGSRCCTVSKKGFVSTLIIYMTKLVNSDWLRAVQFFCKQCKKSSFSAKRGNKPSILIGQWSKKLTDVQSNLLLSNQVRALAGAIYDAIFPWLRDNVCFFCLTILKFFHVCY